MTRSDAIAQLADDILMTGRPVHLATVLDAVLDEPLVSNDDAVQLLFGTDEQKLDARERCEKAAQAVVVSYLECDRRGIALVDERIERERDEEDEQLTGEAA